MDSSVHLTPVTHRTVGMANLKKYVNLGGISITLPIYLHAGLGPEKLLHASKVTAPWQITVAYVQFISSFIASLNQSTLYCFAFHPPQEHTRAYKSMMGRKLIGNPRVLLKDW